MFCFTQIVTCYEAETPPNPPFQPLSCAQRRMKAFLFLYGQCLRLPHLRRFALRTFG